MSTFESIDAEIGNRTPPRCGSNDISPSSEWHFAVASREFTSQATPFARRLVGAFYIALYLLIASFAFPNTAISAAGTVTLDGSQWHIDRRTAVLPKSTILQAELAEGAEQLSDGSQLSESKRFTNTRPHGKRIKPRQSANLLFLINETNWQLIFVKRLARMMPIVYPTLFRTLSVSSIPLLR